MARRQVSIYINGREIENSLKQIAAEKRKVNNELNKMIVGSDEYNAKVQELRGLNGIIRQHNEALRPVASSYAKLPALLSGIAAGAAGAFTVDAIISYGKKLFDLGAQMDLLSKKAQTVFGAALPAITREAEANATQMGLTTAQYINQAAAIGDLLIPMGFQREEAANISGQLVNLSGALSEWTGGQITTLEVSTKLSKALLGEREELKALGISISQADVDARLAAEGLDVLTGNALQQAEAMATLNLVMEKSIDAQNSYIENSDNLVRKQAEIRARFQEIQERLATALIPVFERLVGIAGEVSKVITTIVGGLTGVGTASNRASDAVAKLQGQFNLEIETLQRGNISQENRRILIDKINSQYKEYLPNLIKETDSLQDLERAQLAANKAFLERITQLALQERLEETTRKLVDAKKEELELQLKLTVAQQNFARSAEQANQLVYGEGGERNIRQAQSQLEILNKTKDAVKANATEQKALQQELIQSQKLARELGVALGGGAPQAPTGPGSGTGSGTGTTSPKTRPTPQRPNASTPKPQQFNPFTSPEFQLFNPDLGEAQPIPSNTAAYYEEEEKALNSHYNRMLDLQTEWEASKKQLQKSGIEFQNQLFEEGLKEQIEIAEKTNDVMQNIGNALVDLLYIFAGESKTVAEFARGIAIAQIAADTARAISGVVAAASSNSITPIDLAIKITAGIATVLANIAKAKQLLSTPIPEAPQRYTGGYYDVRGQQDNRQYRAKYLGQPSTGLLPGSPSLVLASERGPEYFVSNDDLRNPQVMNYVRAIENIRQSRTAQYVDGGATQPLPGAGAALASNQLVPLLQEISSKLDVLYARIDDPTVVGIFNRYRVLNDVAGGGL